MREPKLDKLDPWDPEQKMAAKMTKYLGRCTVTVLI